MQLHECESCHKKENKKTSQECPANVVEINNPSEVVLFHKLLVPAAAGDDVTMPPYNGRWHNALVEYEANGHLYLFSSDGIPTRLPNFVEE